MEQFDVVVIGAGSAGMSCAAQAGLLGCWGLLLDNGKKPGRKILMSGGGRCNFTNMHTEGYVCKERWCGRNAIYNQILTSTIVVSNNLLQAR